MVTGYRAVAHHFVFIATICVVPVGAEGSRISTNTGWMLESSPPVATTQAPAGVGISSATLRGSINPGNAETTYYFDWGTTTEYGNRTSARTVPAGESVVSVSAELTGLAVATQYHYRLVAENAEGRSTGANFSFTTGVPPPPAPILLSPSNNADAQTEPVTLRWASSLGASTYRVQVSGSPNFQPGDLVLDEGGLTATSYELAELTAGATYHWRAAASGQGGSSPWSGTRRFTMAAAPPVVQTLSADEVTLSSARLRGSITSTSEQNEVYFEWGPTDALGNQTAVRNQSGTPEPVEVTALLSGLAANEEYFFRFTARNEGGTAHGAVLSFRTGAPPPEPPGLLSPVDGADGVSTSTVLQWAESAHSTRYLVEVTGHNIAPASVVFSEEITGTTVDIPDGTLSGRTTYAWHVRGIGDGGAGPWSATWNFTTRGEAPHAATLAVTDVTQSAAVLNGRVDTRGGRTTAFFEWGTSTSYGNKTEAIILDPTTQPEDIQAAITGLASGVTYHYRLVAENDGGESAGENRSFVTGTPAPPAPVQISPQDNQENVAFPVRLEWSPAGGADSYELQVAEDAELSAIVAEPTGLAETSFAFEAGELGHSSVYHWRVRAVGAGGAGPWSGVRRFETAGGRPTVATAEATAITPSGAMLHGTVSANGSETVAFFEWGLNGSFANSTAAVTIPKTGSDVEVSSPLEGLSAGRTYSFRLVAENASGRSEGTTRTFDTIEPSPSGAPTLASPPYGATDLPTSVTLSWNAVTAATSYHVQVASRSDFSAGAIAASQPDVSGTSYAVDELETGTQYYWRVRANLVALESEWSAIWSFSTETEPGPLGSPTLVSPARAATAVSSSATLSWQPVPRATDYRVQLSSNINFAEDSVRVDSNGITAHSKAVNGLSPGETYFWRVAARRGEETGSWSAVWSFTTYPAEVSVKAERTFSDPNQSNSYRMMGIPGDVNVPIADVMRGRPENDWVAFHDDGREDNGLVRYDGSPLFNFRPGHAFWVLGTQPISFERTVPTVPVGADATFSIPVNSGWNIIANPFEVPVNWLEVQEVNDVDELLWGFEGHFANVLLMHPYRGYYFHNTSGLTQLKIPYPGRNGTPAAQRSDGGLLTLKLTTFEDTFASAAVAIDPAVRNGSAGAAGPPAHFELAAIRFLDGGEALRVMAVSADGLERRISLSNSSDTSLELVPSFSAGWTGRSAAVIDRERGRVFPLSDQQPSVRIPPGETMELTLVIGSGEYVEATAAAVKPADFALLPNYPNPFNPVTTITFTLPERSEVQIDVFDANGRRVAVPFSGTAEPGTHEAQWNAANDPAGLASGVYFVRMRSGGFSALQPVILLK